MGFYDRSQRRASPVSLGGHPCARERRRVCIEAGASLEWLSSAASEECPIRQAAEGAIVEVLVGALGQLTLEEAGHVLGVKKQRVSQLENRALRHVRRRFRLMGWSEERAAELLSEATGRPSAWDQMMGAA